MDQDEINHYVPERDEFPDAPLSPQETIAQLKDQIVVLEKAQAKALEALSLEQRQYIREIRSVYDQRLLLYETQSEEAVQKEYSRLTKSLTWRIGRFQVAALLLIVNLIRNPCHFLLKKEYRWKNIRYFEEPTTGIGGKKTTGKSDIEALFNEKPDASKLTFISILDGFSQHCFTPEFNLIGPSPGNWRNVMNKIKCDAVFAESAWNGNDGEWTMMTHNLSGVHRLDQLKTLVNTAKKKGIKTIFWNKEDPVHFKAFIDTAGFFDFVFTSDYGSVQNYLSRLPNKQVFVLPFAAQHHIHNPLRKNTLRDKAVCFAGSYFNDSHPERRFDLDYLLKPALDFDLEIYDRNHGSTATDRDKYLFPDQYHPFIKGKLPYQEMVDVYKNYKVFLNVNSVKYSSSMFARRVFELLACGTPVISNYSKGILNLLGEETVLISESEKDTRTYLEKLFADRHFWWKQSLLGMRTVLETHTYHNRARQICSVTGLPYPGKENPMFLIISGIDSREDAIYLSHIIKEQQYQKYQVLLIVRRTPGNEESMNEIEQLYNFTALRYLYDDQEQNISQILSDIEYSYAVRFSPRHFYGKNYLRDLALAVLYASPAIMGKKEAVSLAGNGEIVIPQNNSEYNFTRNVIPDTLAVRKDIIQEGFSPFGHNPVMVKEDILCLSLDPYNFLADGRAGYLSDPLSIQDAVGI